MPRHAPLVLVLAAAILAATAPASSAGALDRLLEGSPAPSPSPPTMPAVPEATPTPTGPFFDSFYHAGGDEGTAVVDMNVHASLPGGKDATYAWSAPTGTFTPPTAGNTSWQGPKGPRSSPLVVPLTVAIGGGPQPLMGKITVTVDLAGSARVTSLELPGLKGGPDDFEGCFVAGTPVRLADGTARPIEQVRKGDRVAAFDERRHRAGVATVQATLVHADHPYAVMDLRTADGHELRATPNHPFRTPAGRWVQAADLVPGDWVMVFAGGSFHPQRVTTIVRAAGHARVVYNLRTSLHDYVAADVLVHNKCLAGHALVDTPAGPVPVAALRPGMWVLGADGRPTRVTRVHAKATTAPALPGKRLAPGVDVTTNHRLYVAGRWVEAATLPGRDVAIAGPVYDLETMAGGYRAGGYAMGAAPLGAAAA